jgi:hypothetical protein
MRSFVPWLLKVLTNSSKYPPPPDFRGLVPIEKGARVAPFSQVNFGSLVQVCRLDQVNRHSRRNNNGNYCKHGR